MSNPNGPKAAPTKFANFAQYVAQVNLAAAIGTVPAISDELAAGGPGPQVLVEPEKIRAYRSTIADQLNAGSAGPTFTDLSDRIADIIIDTVAQGASTLEVHLIDPMWIIPMSGFIQVDEVGYLWPPIEVNFPPGTGCWWRLVQYAPTWGDMTEANLVLTFEDKIANQLRQVSPGTGGVQHGRPNQTLGGFFKQLVDSANRVLSADIRLIELISPQDPNYTVPVTALPKSAEKKLKTGLTATQQRLVARAGHRLAELQSTSAVTIAEAESRFMRQQAIQSGGRQHPLEIGTIVEGGESS